MVISKTLNRHENGGVVYYTFPKLEAAGGNLHAFSTRLGGVSTGDCASMSFGFSLGDDRDNVLENYRRFCAAFGANAENVILYNDHQDTKELPTAAALLFLHS